MQSSIAWKSISNTFTQWLKLTSQMKWIIIIRQIKFIVLSAYWSRLWMIKLGYTFHNSEEKSYFLHFLPKFVTLFNSHVYDYGICVMPLPFSHLQTSIIFVLITEIAQYQTKPSNFITGPLMSFIIIRCQEMGPTTIRYATGIASNWLINSTLNPIVQDRPLGLSSTRCTVLATCVSAWRIFVCMQNTSLNYKKAHY